jgi:ABC-type uncharacterized transport system substrate-binding protein
MNRRAFMTLLTGAAAAAWPLAARAQQPAMPRVGVLVTFTDSDVEGQRYLKAFLQGLQELGWADGRNVQIEYRWGGPDRDRIRTYAAELVALKPDVILAQTALAVVPLQQATRTIPIVFTQINDPLESGFVASLARPGGNLTGFTPFEFSATAKWLQILKELVPSVKRVAIILNPIQAPNVGMLRAIEAVAPSFAVRLTAAGVTDAAEIERAVEGFAREPDSGVIVLPNPITIDHRELIIALAAGHRLPVVYPYRYFVAEGGLVSYGADPADLFRRAAAYVDRILRGAKPGELPVQQPTKFDLVINLKTAKALGLDVPLHFQQLADEVIE